jgi:hypothetical protein
MHQHFPVVRLLDEVVQHFFRYLEVGNHTVLHWLNSHNVARRPAQHLFGFFAYGLNFAGVFVDRHDGGLIYHNALAFGIHQRIGRPQINSEIAGKHAEERAQIMNARIF